MSDKIPRVLDEIAQSIESAGGSSYLVGGWVRDFILGLDCKDYDVEVYGLDFDALQEVLRCYGRPSFVGKAFGVFTLGIQGERYDFSFPRTEVKTGSGHTGFSVQANPNLSFAEASLRRDFTINSMGMCLPQMELEDPNGGQRDLEAKLLRHIGPAFGEDPLRALRAVQLAARFELDVHEDTRKICSEQDLSELSRERFFEEFRKLLLKAKFPSRGYRLLVEMDLVRFFPELVGGDRQVEFMLDAMASRRNDLGELELSAMFSALCAFLSKQDRKRFLFRITREKNLIKQVHALCDEQERPLTLWKNRDKPGGDGALRRLSLKVRLSVLLELACARHEAVFGENFAGRDWFRSSAEKLGVWQSPPKPFLGGADLSSLGVPPGPEMGRWLHAVFEKQLNGRVKSRDEAIDWLRGKLAKP